MWAQARILGTGDNSSNGSAEGAMFLQTRALYNPGVGGSWNWRTNMVLRASGNVGIGTVSPSTKLDVNGVITATGGTSTQWNTAYGWGNHASAGYLTSYTETDTLATVTGRGATTTTTLNVGKVITTGLYGQSLGGNNSIWQYDASNLGYGIIYNEGSPDTLRIDVSGQAVTGTPDFLVGPDYAQVNGNNVWHAGNDGAGSGLDADLLDGNQSSASSTANTIALRDSVGDISAREFVLTASTIHTTTPSSIVGIFPTTNQVVKFADTAVRAFLNVPTRTGGDASGTWAINVTGNAATATSATSAATSTAASIFDLLPSARTTFAWSVQLTAGTWADIFSSTTVLSNGTWMVQVYVDDFGVGGTQYQETYSGIMSWGSANSTNNSGISGTSEIILHRSGHAANSGNFYLRTVERTTSTLVLQGMSNMTYTAASTINFKFVKVF